MSHQRNIRRGFFLLPILCAALAPTLVQAAAATVNGAGATFPAKVYAQWVERFAGETGARVDYQPTGSSDGVKQMTAKVVDFGATDVPLAQAELDKRGLFQFPTFVGGVVPVVNLPGIPAAKLRLSGPVLAGIFAGRIQQWSDPAIAVDNPNLKLPDLRITRVVRADGSGTTEVFVGYLKQVAAVAAEPIKALGGKAEWPGQPAAVEGSDKVGQTVKATPGAIGYISSDYVLRESLPSVTLRNRRGEWITPSVESYGAALRASGLFRADLAPGSMLDMDGPNAWPMVTATYILVERAPRSAERAAATLNFFYRSFQLGDQAVSGSGFAPLPVKTQGLVVKQLAGFKSADGKPIYTLSYSGPTRK